MDPGPLSARAVSWALSFEGGMALPPSPDLDSMSYETGYTGQKISSQGEWTGSWRRTCQSLSSTGIYLGSTHRPVLVADHSGTKACP